MSKRLTTEEFIKRSKEVHGNKYDYSKVNYVNCYTKIIIICPEHGKFLQTPSNHVSKKYGCQKCFNKSHTLSRDYFIKIAKKIHGNKYDYSKVIYKNSHTKVIIICPKHGEFLQIPNSHLRGHGCLLCVNKEQASTFKEFIKKAKDVHENIYDYSKVNYINRDIKIIIICPKHGKFLQTPNNHLTGRGCPVCKASKGELLIAKTLNTLKINYIKQKTFDDFKNPITKYKLRYDFYLPKENLLIEFNGRQHYKYIKLFHKKDKNIKYQQYRDSLKKQYAISNGYNFLIIKHDDDIEKILKTNIRPF